MIQFLHSKLQNKTYIYVHAKYFFEKFSAKNSPASYKNGVISPGYRLGRKWTPKMRPINIFASFFNQIFNIKLVGSIYWRISWRGWIASYISGRSPLDRIRRNSAIEWKSNFTGKIIVMRIGKYQNQSLKYLFRQKYKLKK